LPWLLTACDGSQSALAPAGRGAERIAELFWWMTTGSVVIWLGVVGLTAYAIRSTAELSRPRVMRLLIVGGGFVFPTVVLAGLLVLGLSMLRPLLAAPPQNALRVAVTGEQWWWRVRYFTAAGEAVDLANEIRLPVGRVAHFELDSRDVIHAFWIPSLGGKVDMIPGRQTRLLLSPTAVGAYRGTCAEYCGDSHAWMSFPVVVMEEEEFSTWLAEQAKPALPPTTAESRRGGELFLENGCGACHSVRGTDADGVIGPDLTHVGSRSSLAAGLLANETADFVGWVARTHELKPGATMPAFGMLAKDDLHALGVYLDGLR
jgi:cytochrome c oxidase subunit 2